MSTYLFENMLVKMAEFLDMPDHLHEDAVNKYQEVAEWLGESDSPISQYSPIAYPQGSFRLGTVIKPVTDNDAYDMDFVCRLNLEKSDLTKKQLMKMVGDRLKQHDDYSRIIEPKGRCWALNFSDNFHMDILPTIPDQDEKPHGIWLTDRDLAHWQPSNPIKYSEWFKIRMSMDYSIKLAEFAKSRKIEVAAVQEWQVKSVLQQSVQILKRHRDIFFERTPNLKPPSIIITTLCGYAYEGQSTLSEALPYLIRNMDRFVDRRNGYVIKSPVSDENFADKWNSELSKKDAFKKWIVDLHGGFLQSIEGRDTRMLSPLVGQRLLEKAVGSSSNIMMKSESALPAIIQVPALEDASHAATPSWSQSMLGSASLSAEVYTISQKRKLSDLIPGHSVAKRRYIKFKLKTNIPKPYDVKWQVVNTGKEAENNLRGGFYDSELEDARWEKTEYRGTHFVEAFVLKGNVCVARTGRFLVRIRNSIL